MGREHDIQAALAPVFPLRRDDGRPLPRRGGDRLGLLRDGAARGHHPAAALPFEATPEQVSALCERAWDVLVDLHAVDVPAIPALAALGRGEGYVARQVAGWTDRLARAATDDLGDWSPVTAWLDEHQPDDVGQCLIHNDFRFDNLVLSPDRLAGHGRSSTGRWPPSATR